jgi:hypothetical protein
MKYVVLRIEAVLVLMSVVVASLSCGANNQPANSAQAPGNIPVNAANTAPPSAPVQALKFTPQELDEIMAPIALYPDPLLAQMLPAATFVDQLTEAQRTLNGRGDDSLIANQDWDVSVKSVAHYPPVLKTMTDDLDWTTTLGQAFISQPEDINRSIQRLRFQASDAGNLVTTPQAEVIEKDNIIMIEPAQPEVIYVPQYNSETVYVEQAPYYEDPGVSTGDAIAVGAIAFTTGLLIGAWLNRDYDYYGYYGPPGPYYHGWVGGGWVGVNRGYVDVDVNRNVYINDSYRNMNVNRNVYNRNVSNYRNNVTTRSVARDQRATNARVNRQLNRQPNRDLNNGRDLNNARNLDNARDVGDRGGNRGQGQGWNMSAKNVDRKDIGGGHGGGPQRNAGNDRQRDSRSNDRQRDTRSNDRSSSTRSSGGDRQVQNRSQPQRQNSAPRQQPQQRSAPSRSGGGGRRRG